MLESSVHNIYDLYADKQQTSQFKTQTGSELSYMQNVNLLHSSAT